MIISGKNINLRLVEEKDAQFITELRLKKGEFLSKSSTNVEEQKKWIKQYKERESKKLEYYFVIEGKNSEESFGVVRIYDISYFDKTFTFGSFIVDKDIASKYCSLESMTLVLEFCFSDLQLENCYFDCRIDNLVANNFYVKFGALEIKRDNLDIYYFYSKDIHIKNHKKYLNLV